MLVRTQGDFLRLDKLLEYWVVFAMKTSERNFGSEKRFRESSVFRNGIQNFAVLMKLVLFWQATSCSKYGIPGSVFALSKVGFSKPKKSTKREEGSEAGGGAAVKRKCTMCCNRWIGKFSGTCIVVSRIVFLKICASSCTVNAISNCREIVLRMY
jgi:hypothetical protein